MSSTAPETTTVEESADPDFEYISREGAIALLDELAHEYLGIGGDEFVRRYRAGDFGDGCDTDVMMLAMIIPLIEQ